MAMTRSSATLAMMSRHTHESHIDVARGFGAAIAVVAATIAQRCEDHQFVKNLSGDPDTGIGVYWLFPPRVKHTSGEDVQLETSRRR